MCFIINEQWKHACVVTNKHPLLRLNCISPRLNSHSKPPIVTYFLAFVIRKENNNYGEIKLSYCSGSPPRRSKFGDFSLDCCSKLFTKNPPGCGFFFSRRAYLRNSSWETEPVECNGIRHPIGWGFAKQPIQENHSFPLVLIGWTPKNRGLVNFLCIFVRTWFTLCLLVHMKEYLMF